MRSLSVSAVVFAALTAMSLGAQTPAPRLAHVMSSAGPAGGVLMIGGAIGNTPRLTDTLWMWTGSAWRILSDAGPHSRAMPAAVFDTRRHGMARDGRAGPERSRVGARVQRGHRFMDSTHRDSLLYRQPAVPGTT